MVTKIGSNVKRHYKRCIQHGMPRSCTLDTTIVGRLVESPTPLEFFFFFHFFILIVYSYAYFLNLNYIHILILKTVEFRNFGVHNPLNDNLAKHVIDCIFLGVLWIDL